MHPGTVPNPRSLHSGVAPWCIIQLGVVLPGQAIFPLASQNGRIKPVPLEDELLLLEDELLEEPLEEVEGWQGGVGEFEREHKTGSEQLIAFAFGQHIVAPLAKHFIHVPVRQYGLELSVQYG